MLAARCSLELEDELDGITRKDGRIVAREQGIHPGTVVGQLQKLASITMA